jgi:outer membrane protein assembly factor BamE (lipoprotein component of BamABCDE complex)
MRTALQKGAISIGVALLVGSALQGCMSAADHRADVANPINDRVTVGTVQREIRVGMSSADVIAVLGSPNVVTTDDQRNENWVYDKIATDTAYSASKGGISSLILGGGLVGGGVLGGGVGGAYSQSSGATSTSQRTLTIVIKFDGAHRVRDFAYRQSSF